MNPLTQEQADRLDQILNVEDVDVVEFVDWTAASITSHVNCPGDRGCAILAKNLVFLAGQILRDNRTVRLLPAELVQFVEHLSTVELREQLGDK